MLRVASAFRARPLAVSARAARALATGRAPVTVLSDDELALRETVRKFAQETVAPHVQSMDAAATMRPEVIKACFDQGLMGIETDTELSGAGMSFFSSCLVVEELARVDASVSVMVDVQNTLANVGILKWGTPEQKKRWLPRLATNTVASFCLSEWGSGSDAFALKTRAEDRGSHYVLNGSKAWITNSKEAGLFVVFATTDPALGYKGISAFVVDERSTPGLTVQKPEDKLGIRASSTCEVTFADVRVPKENVLGPLGKGYKIAIESLNEGRIGIGAQMLGIAQGAYDLMVPYILERKQFGQRVADFQGMQFLVARCAVEIEAARLMVYNAARLKEAGLPFQTEAAMAKLYASEVAESVASRCVDALGGMGFVKAQGVEKFYRDAKIGKVRQRANGNGDVLTRVAAQIYEGTSHIQLETIAKQVYRAYQ